MKFASIFHQTILLALLVFSQNVQPTQSLNVIFGDDVADSLFGSSICLILPDLGICNGEEVSEEDVSQVQDVISYFLGSGPDAPATTQTSATTTPAGEDLTPLDRIQNGVAIATTLLSLLEMVQGLRNDGGNRRLRGAAQEELVANELGM